MNERDARRTLYWMLALFVTAALGATLQQHTLRNENNFLVFRNAFTNLVAGRDLYALYPEVHRDQFKYSPTFALLFAPLALLPVALALALWNVLNVAALWAAIRRLLPPRAALLALVIIALELFGSTQRAQSNALVTALVLAAWMALERARPARAALAVGVGTMIKIFPLAAASLALPHPRRLRFGLLLAASLAVLALLPLLVTSPATLVAQYRSWIAIERYDALVGLVPGQRTLISGVMQQLRLWAGWRGANWPVQLTGTVIFLLPLALRRERWGEQPFRLRLLASLLIYMVIFNHQAESPSFVIAMTGVAIWYVISARSAVDLALLLFALLFVSVAPSSLTPHDLRTGLVLHYGVKTVPCLVIWLVLQAELLGLRRVAEPAEVREFHSAEGVAHAG